MHWGQPGRGLQAIATAMAVAIVEISGDCEVQGKGFACALGSGEIKVTAKVSLFCAGCVHLPRHGPLKHCSLPYVGSGLRTFED